MALRRDIVEAVFNEVQSIAVGDYTVTKGDGSTETVTITNSDVLRYYPDVEEKHPAVFVDFGNETPLNYSGVGTSPDHIEYDSTGDVIYASWNEHIEMETFVTIRGDSRVQKEPIFSNIRRQLGRYDIGDKNSTKLHEDVQLIDVEETSPADTTAAESIIWGDQIQLYVQYLRRYIVETGGSMTIDEAVDSIPAISKINMEVDANTDFSDTGFTYTVN